MFFKDPYHGPGQAMGLSFSVPEGVKVPSSLVNIFKELKEDLGCSVPPHGNLEKWAVQVSIANSRTANLFHFSLCKLYFFPPLFGLKLLLGFVWKGIICFKQS